MGHADLTAELGPPEGVDEGAEATGADDRYFGRFVGRHEPEGGHGGAAAATPLAAGGNPIERIGMLSPAWKWNWR